MKRITSIIFTLLITMCLLLSGCGKSAESSTDKTEKKTTKVTEAAKETKDTKITTETTTKTKTEKKETEKKTDFEEPMEEDTAQENYEVAENNEENNKDSGDEGENQNQENDNNNRNNNNDSDEIVYDHPKYKILGVRWNYCGAPSPEEFFYFESIDESNPVTCGNADAMWMITDGYGSISNTLYLSNQRYIIYDESWNELYNGYEGDTSFGQGGGNIYLKETEHTIFTDSDGNALPQNKTVFEYSFSGSGDTVLTVIIVNCLSKGFMDKWNNSGYMESLAEPVDGFGSAIFTNGSGEYSAHAYMHDSRGISNGVVHYLISVYGTEALSEAEFLSAVNCIFDGQLK